MNTYPTSPAWARLSFAFLVALAILVIRVAPAARGESRIWTEPVQVSTDADSAVFGFMTPNVDAFRLHVLVVESLTVAPVWQFSPGSYLRVGPDLDWGAAWTARERYTFQPGGNGGTIDVSGIVDANDSVHVAYEAFEGVSGLSIGYKTRGTPRWSSSQPSFHLASLASNCTPTSPTVCIQDTTPDKLHVLYTKSALVGTTCADSLWLFHRSRSLDNPPNDSTWSAETRVTDAFRRGIVTPAGEEGKGPPFVFDASGTAHIFGKLRVAGTSVDSIWVFHVFGTPPASGDWSTDVDTLDTCYRLHTAPETEEGGIGASIAASPVRGEEAIDVVWLHTSTSTSTEVWFARIPTDTNEPSARYAVTPVDGVTSNTPRLWHTSDGRVHLMYTDRQSASIASIRYTYSDDPTTEGSWAPPEPVTPDVATWAAVPSFTAIADSLWVLYLSGDDSDEADGGRATSGSARAGRSPTRRSRTATRHGYRALCTWIATSSSPPAAR